MSQFLARTEQDPINLFLKSVQKIDEERKQSEIVVEVSRQLEATIDFDLTSLAQSGQLALLQISDKYGAMLFAYGPELIVVPNSQLNQVLDSGDLNPGRLLAEGSNKTNSNHIIFLKVHDDQLFLQHSGEDYLLIADLPAVIRNPKKGLMEALRCKLDCSEGTDVRQVSVSGGGEPYATVVTRSATNEHSLLVINYSTGGVLHRKDEFTTAVFSPDGASIVAGKDSYDEHIVVMDLSLREKNKIGLSFPQLSDKIEVDRYRIFWINEAFQNNFVVFAAYHATQEDFDEKIGKTLMLWFGEDLCQPGLTLDALKARRKVKAHFWDFDHQCDAFIPSFHLEWTTNPKYPNEMLGFAMQNHCDQPYMFKVKDGDLAECYELTSANQLINRPMIPGTDEYMEPQETLGACLGFQILKTQMTGAPATLSMTLIEDEGEEDLPYPQTMIFYSLDGKLKQYQIFTRQWRGDALTHPALPLQKSQPPNKLAAQSQISSQCASKPKEQEQTKSAETEPQTKPGPSSVFAPGGLFSSSTLSGSLKATDAKLENSLFAKPSEKSPFKSVENPFGTAPSKGLSLTHPQPGLLPFGNEPFKSPFSMAAKTAEIASTQIAAPSTFLKQEVANPLLQQAPAPVDEKGKLEFKPASLQQSQSQTQSKPANPLFSQPLLSMTSQTIEQRALPETKLAQEGKPLLLASKSDPMLLSDSIGQQMQGTDQDPSLINQIFSQKKQPLQSSVNLTQSQPVLSKVPQQQPQSLPQLHSSSLGQAQAASSQQPLQQAPDLHKAVDPMSLLSPEQQLALTHSNIFAEAYNQKVVAAMQKVKDSFPSSTTQLFRDMDNQRSDFLKVVERSMEEKQIVGQIRDFISSTQRLTIAMTGQQLVCERLKKETLYGILGDQSVSAAQPGSVVVKLSQSYRDFLMNADSFSAEDRAILLEVFEKGNLAVDEFDQILARQVMSETLQALQRDKLRQVLTAEEQSRLFGHSESALKRNPFFNQPAALQSAEDRLKEKLMMNAGIMRRESDTSRIQVQTYIIESTKFLNVQIRDVKADLLKVQARLNTPSKSPDRRRNSNMRPKYGDPDELGELERLSRTESETKMGEEGEPNRVDARKMVRNRQRQKKLQKQLLAQVTQPKVCKLELPVRQWEETKAVQQPASQSVQALQTSALRLEQVSKSKQEIEKETLLIQKFVGGEDRKKERNERAVFIASLDAQLITSPNLSPRPKIDPGSTTLATNRSQLGTLSKSRNPDNPKPVESSLNVAPPPLAEGIKPTNSFISFGSRQSDALQPQRSSMVHPQMSFGDEPKPLTSMQKKNQALDQIEENDTPKKTPPAEKKATAVAAAAAQGAPILGMGSVAARPKPLEKQPSMSRLNIDGLGSQKTKTAADGPDLKPQQTGNQTSVQKPTAPAPTSSLFGPIAKPAPAPDSQKSGVNQLATTASLAGGIFGKKAGLSSSEQVPQSNAASEPPDKPAPSATGLVAQSDKPKDQTSLLATHAQKTQPATGFGQGATALKESGSSTIFGSAASKGPTIFGQVDITTLSTAKPPEQKAFAAFGSHSSASAQPMTFSSQGASSGGVFLQFGNQPQQSLFGQQASQPANIFGIQQPQQPGFIAGGGQQALAQPNLFGPQLQPFQGFGGGGAFSGSGPAKPMSESMLKPRK